MKHIKSFKIFESLKENYLESLSEDNRDLKADILELIENTTQTDSKEALREFIESYLKGDSKIEGFINDADIYEFYLKYTDSIDAILESIDYFSRVPKDNNIFGVYQYIIESTKVAMEKILKEIRFDIFNIQDETEKETEMKESLFNIFKRNNKGSKLVAVDSPVRDKFHKKVTFIYLLTTDIRALLIGEVRFTTSFRFGFVNRVIKRAEKTSTDKLYAWEEIHKYRDLTTEEYNLVKDKLLLKKQNQKGDFVSLEDEVVRITKMPINWK